MWPSLFVLGGGLLLLAASLLTARAYQWSAIVLLALACAPWRRLPANALSAITGLYCAWLFTNAAFLTPAYSAEGIYRPLILLGAFASIAALTRENRIRLFHAGLALIAVLVLVGLLQTYLGFWHVAYYNPRQVAATFVTPNTFATAINLFLLPLAAAYLSGHGGARVLMLMLWLFAGLVASQSRGGMLALLAGLAFIVACIGLRALWQTRARGLRLLAGLAIVGAVMLAPRLLSLSGGIETAAEPPGTGGIGSSTVQSSAPRLGFDSADRREIYAATLALILEHPFKGAGANMFFPLFEIAKPDSLQGKIYFFAHNDYFQHWLEFGAPGLALLVLLAATALVFAHRSSKRAAVDPVPLTCGAALASCFAHAMVDFPLFIPFILMVVGGYLGALAAHIGDCSPLGNSIRSVAGVGIVISPAVRWVLVLCALAWISQPVLADVAGQRAVAELLVGRPGNALYWQSIARRLEPRSAAQYWTEGVILRDQAVAAHDRALAAKADAIFSAGIRADPYQVSNYLERARTFRRHPGLFDALVARQEAVVLTGEALRLRPYSYTVRAEHVRSLALVGRVAEAKGIVEVMRTQNPDSSLARGLALELNMPAAKEPTR